MTNFKIHPLAETFPPFSDSEFESLVKDIGANGQREPITLFEGKILDGVHRFKACQQLNREPRVRNYTGTDPLGFSVSENLKRRHLNESQRALIAAQIANKNGGRESNRTQLATVSNKGAATMLNVSEHSVDRAKQVLKDAPKKEVQAIQSGKKTVNAVVREIKAAKVKPEQVLDKVGRAIPDDLVAEWQRAEQVGKKLRSLAFEIKNTIADGFAGAKGDKLKDHIYAEVAHHTITDIEALAYTLGTILPYALCPTCNGHERKQCTLCRRRGWISKFMWNGPVVGEDLRRLLSGGKA